MKKSLFLIYLSILSTVLTAQDNDPSFQWAVHGGSPGTDFILDMAIDDEQNAIITGYFQETLVLGAYTIQSNGLDDFFVAKLDPTGEVLWLKGFGGVGLDAGFAVETDFLGNIVVLGYMQDDVDFDGATLSSAGTYDICLFKLAPDGSVLWARRDGGSGQDQAFGLAVDNQANIYVTGFFAGQALIGNNLMTSDGFLDAVLFKVNAAGGVDWVQNGGGSGNDLGQAIDVDEAGDVYVTGSFENSAAFGNNILTATGSSDVFIAKYSTNSTLLWAKKAGGASAERPFDIIYHDGDITLTGFFIGNANFDFSNLSSAGEQDIFLAKYSDTGIHQWAKSFGGINDDWGRKLDHNEDGDIYLGGFFEGFAAFDTDGVGAQSGQDAYIAKTDESGDLYWVESIGGFGEDECFGLVIDSLSDQLYVGLDFNQNAIVTDTSIITFGNNDFIIAAFLDTSNTQIVVPPDTMTSILTYADVHISLYPIPAESELHIRTDLKDYTYSIYEPNGVYLFSGRANDDRIQIGHLSSGIYLIEIKDSEGMMYTKIFSKL